MRLSTHTKIKIARWASKGVRLQRKLFRQSWPLVRVKRSGFNWDLDLQEGIDFSIYLLGGFEPRTLSQYSKWIKPGSIALDIGANIGSHTLPLARAVAETGHVYAFEPTRFAFQKLLANLNLNPIFKSRVTPVQAFLGLKSGTTPPAKVFSSWPLEHARKKLHPLHGGSAQSTQGVMATSVDEWSQKIALKRLDFVKLDVDGFEGLVIKGAAETFKRFKPMVMVELAPSIFDTQDGALELKFSSLIQMIRDYGYTIENIHTHEQMPLDADKLNKLIAPGSSVNVLLKAATQ